MFGKDKKGSIQDLILISVVLLIFSVSILFGFKIYSEIDTKIQGSSVIEGLDNGNYATSSSTTMKNHYTGIFDNIFLFLTVGLMVTMLVLAALVRVHPVFIALFFIVLLITIFLCGVLSNIYQEMAENTELTVEADQLDSISTIMTYLPFIVGTFGFILMLVMFKVWRDGSEP